MVERDEEEIYVEKTRFQLDDLEEEVEKLERKVPVQRGKSGPLARARRRIRDLRKELGVYRRASGHAVGDLREGMERALKELAHAVQEARRDLRSPRRPEA